jgi:hypothetical protein
MAAVADTLQRIPGARHVIQMGNGDLGGALVTADPLDDAVDHALEQVTGLACPPRTSFWCVWSRSERRSRSARWRASSGLTC